jgi:enoyl-CoA hydratase
MRQAEEAQEEDPSQVVLSERSGPVLTLRMNRPHRLNAVSSTLYRALIQGIEGATDLGARVVVLAGSGRAFCVGADLKAHSEGRSDEQRREYVDLAQHVCLAIQRCPVPVVAAVQGYALGAGAEMALSADFVIMADDARMGFPEIGLGSFFGGGITARMVPLLGLAKTKEVLLLGERFSGRQAAEWGLIHRSVPAEDLDASVHALAGRLASLAPVSVASAKEMLEDARSLDMDTVMRREAELLIECMDTEDWAEGVRAFAEKRSPRFEGR